MSHVWEGSTNGSVDPSFPVGAIVLSTDADDGSIDPSFPVADTSAVVSTDEEDRSSREYSLVPIDLLGGNDDGLQNHARHLEMSGNGVCTCALHKGNDSSWTPKDILLHGSFSLPGQIDGNGLQNYTLSAPMRKTMDQMEYSLLNDGRITPPSIFSESPSVANVAVFLVDKNGKQTLSNERYITPSSSRSNSIGPSSTESTSNKTYVREEDIKDADVLFGQGARSNWHKGNKVYRDRILEDQPEYKKRDNDGKKNMSKRIMAWINDEKGGRFLAFDETPKGKRYYVATDDQVREKVCRALRGDKRYGGERSKTPNCP